MEHRSFAPNLIIPDDGHAVGNQLVGESAPDVAQEELFKEKQMGRAVNCNDLELSTYLQALAVGYLPTFYSGTSQSVQSKLMSIASKSFLRGKKTVVFHGFQSLKMSRHLTDDLGEELLTSFVAAFHAKIFQPPEKELASTASAAECGEKWHGSLAKYDPASSSWKTAQHSLLGDSEEFLETWPRWGMTVNGECWELPTLAHRTNGSGSGSWLMPTPTCNPEAPNHGSNSNGPHNLVEVAASGWVPGMMWRTPSANVIEAKSTVVKLTGRKPSDPQVGLADQVMAAHRMQWPTPTASEHTGAGHGPNKTGAMNLRTMVQAKKDWPTPTVCGNYNRKGLTPTSGDGLATAVAMSLTMNYSADTAAPIVKARTFPTATATAYKGWSPNHNRADTDDRLDYTIEREAYTPGQDAPPMRLSPDWVELLMGWPKGWTSLQPLGAESGRETPRESPAELPTEATA